jgi:hypothetical protein
MHIRKFDFNYSRRKFLEKSLMGAASAGVLTSLWPMIARSESGLTDIGKAYPDELLSIEMHTKGKIKPGDVITADNVEHVAHLLDPIALEQVQTMGRRIHIAETTTDITKLYPHDYLEATLRNYGQAVFDSTGNVRTKDGGPWIGGSPFPDPQNALEAAADITLAWGRNDWQLSAVRDHDITPAGDIAYQYDFVWTELQATARSDGRQLFGRDDILRYNATWFTRPDDVNGTAYLNTWHYDQSEFPELLGYLPAFRRVRKFPTNQRFEPLVPGMVLFLSDAWAAGDPMLTWGNYKIVGRKPMLGAQNSANFMGGRDNWEKPVHGGPKGQTFHDTWMELCPECIEIECEPVGYPRSPVGKRRVWIDVRNQCFVASVTTDRKGEVWKSFEPQFAQYSNEHETFTKGGLPAWSWTGVMIYDRLDGRMTRYYVAKEVQGGWRTHFETNDARYIYTGYMRAQALPRLGG